MKTKKSVIYSILLIIGVVILVNVLSNRYFVRLDFTADKRYTLSEATKDILESLENPVTITAYFSENLPPDIARTRRDFRDLLIEYANRSRGMVVYEFINPNENDENEQEAMKNGVRPVLINVTEKDEVKQQKAFLGAVIRMGEEKEVIPFVQPGSAMEYELSSNIKKLTVESKPKIGFIRGHGEPSLNSLQQALKDLSVLYNVEEVDMNQSINNLTDYQALAIIAPTDSFPASHLDALDNYMAAGNDIFVAYNRVEGDFQRAMGTAVTTGLETWLKQKGITVEENFVIDANCGSVSVQQRQGPFTFNTNVSFPYLPVISNFLEHPITEGLEAVILQFASTITFNGDTNLTFTPLARTSEQSGTSPVPTYFNVQKEWGQRDFPLSNLPVAGVLSGPIVGNQHSNMVLVSDGDFPVGGEGRRQQQLQQDNVSLMVNAIDWLSDETGLIELRTKGITARPLEQVKDSKKVFLKYFNFLLPIILIVIYGIIRFQLNQRLRTKRMEEGYV